ncbi:hypothetical protein BKA67DRAFT_432205 [Truncatella angustata]|uniref:Zn(2)-C6 fungal-type domain-containing protein n=1 Tax=Truncatella angustata TaxID=152316 RepID=A0A9P8RJP2_9PEZI|nr:uncharacterized protein BKA67DRAFT_432205 [Truncatella angustata]KAH6647304.1 hypothetical protein BKA67DRAFT_432205 [Truncatella angustata]
MPRPLRTSCDRCHSQKLKCPKQPGVTTCTRCAKAGASCIFSPVGLNVRRTLASPVNEVEIAWQENAHNLEMNLDWPTWEIDGTLTGLLESHVTPPALDLQKSNPRSTCVQQLSALALDIDNVFGLIPSNPGVHMSKDGSIEDMMANWPVKFTQRQALEQLFASAQRLITIYPSTVDVIFKQLDDEDCDNPNCIHRLELPENLEGELGAFASKAYEAKPLDPFIFNLLLTCHTRVTDVLEVLLVHVSMCAKVTLAMPKTQEPQLHIPELKVGDFVASPEFSSSMQAVMLAHIASVLADRAKQLQVKIANTFRDSNSTKQASMYKLQCEVLVEESESKVVALQKMRDVLVKVGYMR